MIEAPSQCPDCGGAVSPEGKPGRTRRTKGGGTMEIPADVLIPTCRACGAEWMDDATARALAALG